MEVEYIHFYVDDALAWRHWFEQRLGFRSAGGWQDEDSCHERLYCGGIRFLLSSAMSFNSPVADYLAQHPPGVVDVALRVRDLSDILRRAQAMGAELFQKAEPLNRVGQWARISGWGPLRHTLLEAETVETPRSRVRGHMRSPLLSQSFSSFRSSADSALLPQFTWPEPCLSDAFHCIDHVVLNVAAGALQTAVDWYQQLFDLRAQQSFHIQTRYSGLRSQVLVGSPLADSAAQPLQFPINEPESPTSQIQDFLDRNGGSGIQHIALRTHSLLPTVARLRQQQMEFLAVPPSYYRQLPLRPQFEVQGLGPDWAEIVAQQVLVDWHLDRWEGPLLQIFTQPIFPEPTFFFELIERRSPLALQAKPRPEMLEEPFWLESPAQAGRCAQGFGEGNFQALFEAMEREQLNRELVQKR